MIEKKDICVLKFNTPFEPEEIHGMDVIKDIVVSKKKFNINKDFKKDSDVGYATNFVKKLDGLYCDLKYKDDKKYPYTNAYVSIDYKEKKDGELTKCKVDGISVGYTLNAQVAIRDSLK